MFHCFKRGLIAIGLGGSLGSAQSQLWLSPYIFTTIFKKQIVSTGSWGIILIIYLVEYLRWNRSTMLADFTYLLLNLFSFCIKKEKEILLFCWADGREWQKTHGFFHANRLGFKYHRCHLQFCDIGNTLSSLGLL